jgi:hypothetical protein
MATPAGSARTGALAGRYVDDQGKPLTDPAQQPYAEFRMMPINLRLVIEQNQIPKLLAECANSNMPIEVRKFRLLTAEFPPFEPAEGGGAAAAGPAAAGGKQKVQGSGGFRPPAPARGVGPRGKTENPTGEEEECINPMEPPVPVEVQGIIYIYNPPDRQNLGKGTAGGAVAPSGGPAAGPAIPVGPVTAPPGPAIPGPKPAIVPAPGPAPVPGPGKPGPAAPVLPGPGVSPAPPPAATPAPAPPDAPPTGGPAVPPPGPAAPKGGPA